MFPALAGGFLTTAPPGKSPRKFLIKWEKMNTFITLHICNLQSQNYFQLGKTRSFPLKLEKPQNVHYCLQYMVQIFKRNQDEISKEEMKTVQFLTGNFQKIISANK